MGSTKRLAEMVLQALSRESAPVLFADGEAVHQLNKTRFTMVRFGNVLGSSGSVIPLFHEQIRKGGPVTVTHPNITRYFMTIPEACQLVLEAGSMGNGGEIFVFDMGKPVAIADLAKKMILLSGLEIGKDIELKFTGLRPGEKLYEELLNVQENTVPTHHPKIMIAKVRAYDYDQIAQQLVVLRQLLNTGEDQRIVTKIKEIVPEFVSNNSIFEQIDKKRFANDATNGENNHNSA